LDTATPFHIEKVPDLPVLRITLNSTYKARAHQRASTVAVNEYMDQMSEKVFLLYDMGNVKVDWGEMIMGLADARDAYKEGEHRNYRETVIVVRNMLLKMGLRALGQQQYGNMRVTIFETVDEALDYVKSRLS
jgi:hypothetical protein